MKIIKSQVRIETQERERLMAGLALEMCRITQKNRGLLEDGWRVILEERSREGWCVSGTGEPLAVFEATDSSEGGEEAETMLEALRFFGTDAATQPLTGEELETRAAVVLRARGREGYMAERKEILDLVRRTDDPERLPKHVLEWLRDVCGLTTQYGGIRVPWTAWARDEKNPEALAMQGGGEFLIAFAGAEPIQNLRIVLEVLKAIMKGFNGSYVAAEKAEDLSDLLWCSEKRWVYGLSDLQRVPAACSCMKKLGMK